jgi:hypothetical protein
MRRGGARSLRHQSTPRIVCHRHCCCWLAGWLRHTDGERLHQVRFSADIFILSCNYINTRLCFISPVSGHGVCGIPRWSLRSFVAVPTFLAVAATTATLVHTHPVIFTWFHVSSIQSLYHYTIPQGPLIAVGVGVVLLLLGSWASFAECKHPTVEVLVAFFSGSLFAGGLCLGRMTDLHKVCTHHYNIFVCSGLAAHGIIAVYIWTLMLTWLISPTRELSL